MTDPLSVGIPGLDLRAGDHICALYVGQRERDEILLPFSRAGLSGGDKCLCIVDAPDPAEVVASIGAGIDVNRCMATHQLEVRTSAETYLSGGGFAPNRMIEFLGDTVKAALDSGQFAFMRTAGDASWLMDEPPGADEFFLYESELNRFTPRHAQVIVCLYDLERFGGGILVDLLKTHPKVLLGGMVLDNPHFLSPDEYRATRG